MADVLICLDMKREPFEASRDGITLRGELYLPDGDAPVTVVPLCHGIPREGPRLGDPGYLPVAERLVGEGYGALIFNLRGCGVSDGDFDIAGWGRDVIKVTDALLAKPRVAQVVPWGFSGGAAAAVWAAAHIESQNGGATADSSAVHSEELSRLDKPAVAHHYGGITAVALFACPADFATLSAIPVKSALIEYFRKVGIIRDPSFPPDVDAWLRNFELINPEKHIAMISPRPILIIHGTDDTTVPLKHALRLERAAGEPKTLRIIEGAPHRLRESPQALDVAFDWMKSGDRPQATDRRGV